jgi:hypothetical protein
MMPYVTAPGLRMYMRDTHGFSSLGGYQQTTYELSGFLGLGRAGADQRARLTASMFPTLGVGR